MTERHEQELKHLTKQYKVLSLIFKVLLFLIIPLTVLMILDDFGVLNLPLYQHHTRYKTFINFWLGIPAFFVGKKLEKIDNRIEQIDSMYRKKKLTK